MSNISYIPILSDKCIGGVDVDSYESIDDIYMILSECMDPIINLTIYDVDAINLNCDGVYIVDDVVAFLVMNHKIVGSYCEGVATKVIDSKAYSKD